MEQLVYINEEHQRIIEDYMTFVQRKVYEVTETAKIGKFSDFQDLLHDIKQYHNDFFEIALKDDTIGEWMFSIPNLCMFMVMGFFAGLKSDVNVDLIESYANEIHEMTMDTVAVLSDFLKDMESVLNKSEC
tara:strand:+ start:2429 stop:2821 length:393 start_codon:yes stop_codon:yes gene_type:complete